MNINEQKTINNVQTIQAVMKEHQRTMQNDIDELKQTSKEINAKMDASTKEINEKLDQVTSTLEAITAGRKVLIWMATFATAIGAIIVAWVNGHRG
jgi:ADP-dependent phosphofructokinase/glucokinase